MSNKEDLIIEILEKIPGGKFLEVGIGAGPNRKRLQVINDLDIHYTGLDFEDVCDDHTKIIKGLGLKEENIRLIGNSRKGTYLFNLVHMMKAAEEYDYIYFDGHHTLAVDAPPAIVALMLLKNNGLISFDDYMWTLKSQLSNISNSSFYKSMYDIESYTEYEINNPHIKILVEDIIANVFNLKSMDRYSTDMWRTFSVYKK